MGLFKQVFSALLTPYRNLVSPRALQQETTEQSEVARADRRGKKRKQSSDNSVSSTRPYKRRKNIYNTPAKQIVTVDALLDDSSDQGSPAELDKNILQLIQKQREERQLRQQLGMDEVSQDLSSIHLEDDEEDGNNLTDNEQTFTLNEDSFISIEEEDSPKRTGKPFRVIPPLNLDTAPDQQIDQLRDQGWNDTHLELVRLLVYRGRIAVLPAAWQMPFSYMPQVLFTEDNSAILASKFHSQMHGEVAFNRLLDLCPAIRSTVQDERISDGEKFVRRMVPAYIREIMKDTGLWKSRIIPLVTVVTGPETTDSRILAVSAKRRLDSLAARWQEAFANAQIIRSTPNLYAIVGSGSRIAVVVRRPDEPDADLQVVAVLDCEDPDVDFWSALGLALVVCHCRDQLILLGEETGIGRQQPDDHISHDTDL